VAKKKGTRKAGARGTRKKASVRRSVRKAASRPRAPRPVVTGLEDPKKVNLEPVKAIITSQIKRLESWEPRPEVESALRLLRETKATLSSACVSTKLPMVIEF
jgi:hypothetical protein